MVLHIVGYEDVPFRVDITPLTQQIVSALLTEFGNVGVVKNENGRENIRYIERENMAGYTIRETLGFYVLEEFRDRRSAIRRFVESVK